MRKLLLLAVSFSVILKDEDVKELGYEPTEEDFKNYFGIAADATRNEEDLTSEVVKDEGFTLDSLAKYANAKEKKFLATIEEERSEGPAADSKKGATKKEAAPKKEKAQKEAKGPGVIASILEFITAAKKPISQSELTDMLSERFPDKEQKSMAKTVYAQLSGKQQPVRMEKEKGVKFEIGSRKEKDGDKEVEVKVYSLAKK